ncbi:hypothetical protein Tco_1023804 [Tanacetum coccineum]
MNTTQAQQKALDDALIASANRLKFGKCNMRLKTNIKPKEATFQVVLDALALIPFYQAFMITAKFKDLPLEQDILSFIKDLGHTGDITYLIDVNVDYLHQPWRAFATVINKCLSGKETGMDKIHLSRAQILWGMFCKKNIDYVYLLWEDYLFQIEYKDAKKTNKMSYPRFTKIIIDYFMSKDQSISRRNKMFWHTARDDTMFTSMRCISRHEDTQVYDTILPKELTNQAMLESNAYKTYYAFASGEKTLKPKYVQKKADPNTSSKQKPVQDTKGTRLKSKAKVAKPDKKKQPSKKPKAKGLAVLSEVALTEAEQSKVLDEQQQKSSGTDEGIDNENDSDDISDEGDDDNDGNDGDDDDANDDDKEEGDDTNDDDEVTDKEEEEKIDDEETMYDDEDGEVTKELYENVNVNLGYEDIEMTNADQGASEQQNVSQESGFEQVEEDAHVTFTLVLDTQKADEPVQSSSVSSDFTSKLLNLKNPSLTDNEIASLMETLARHATAVPENTSSFTTTIPPPPLFFNPLPQQATKTPTPITSEATTSFPSLPKFCFFDWFKKPERPLTPDPDWSKRQQVDFRPPQTCIRQVVRAEEPPTSFDELNDTSFDFSAFVMNRLKIPNLTQEILVGPAFNLLRGTCKSTTELEYHLEECSKAIIERLDWHNPENKPYSFDLRKPLPLIQDHRGRQIIPKDYFINKDLEYHKGGDSSRRYSTSVTKTKATTYELKWIEDLVPELYASNLTSSKDVYSRRRIIAVTRLNIMKMYDYGHLEDIEVRRDDQKLYTFKEGNFKRLRLQDIEDMLLLLVQQKLTNLTINERYDLNVALRMYTRRIVIQSRVEDLQLVKRKKLMRADELHKFSDGTLNDVRSALHDIDIDKQLYPRRLLRNLKKFVGGREYGNDLRLLERTI